VAAAFNDGAQGDSIGFDHLEATLFRLASRTLASKAFHLRTELSLLTRSDGKFDLAAEQREQ
jgi:hypothetical protein